MSVVFFRFRAAVDNNTLVFDGHGLKLSELKRKIFLQMKFAKDQDLDFNVFNVSNNEQYLSEDDVVPRNTTVVLDRIPPKPSGGVLRYVNEMSDAKAADLMKMRSEMAHRIVNNQDATEEENLLEFQRNQADELANSFAPQQRGFRYPPGTIPPDYYTCNRCHIKGHFIYHCPLGKDGVQARPAATEGLPYNKFFTAQVSNDEAFRPGISQINLDSIEHPAAMTCPIDKKLVENASVVACCQSNFCDNCIREHLSKNSFQCFVCKTRITMDDVDPNEQLRKDVTKYRRDVVTQIQQKRLQGGLDDDKKNASTPPYSVPLSSVRPKSSVITIGEQPVTVPLAVPAPVIAAKQAIAPLVASMPAVSNSPPVVTTPTAAAAAAAAAATATPPATSSKDNDPDDAPVVSATSAMPVGDKSGAITIGPSVSDEPAPPSTAAATAATNPSATSTSSSTADVQQHVQTKLEVYDGRTQQQIQWQQQQFYYHQQQQILANPFNPINQHQQQYPMMQPYGMMPGYHPSMYPYGFVPQQYGMYPPGFQGGMAYPQNVYQGPQEPQKRPASTSSRDRDHDRDRDTYKSSKRSRDDSSSDDDRDEGRRSRSKEIDRDRKRSHKDDKRDEEKDGKEDSKKDKEDGKREKEDRERRGKDREKSSSSKDKDRERSSSSKDKEERSSSSKDKGERSSSSKDKERSSSSSSSSSKDKDKDRKDRDKDRKDRDKDRSSSKDRERSGSSSSKDKNDKDRSSSKDKDKERSSSSKDKDKDHSSSSSSSSKDRDIKDRNPSEVKDDKDHSSSSKAAEDKVAETASSDPSSSVPEHVPQDDFVVDLFIPLDAPLPAATPPMPSTTSSSDQSSKKRKVADDDLDNLKVAVSKSSSRRVVVVGDTAPSSAQ